MRKLYVAGWMFVGLCGVLSFGRGQGEAVPPEIYAQPLAIEPPTQDNAARWFASAKSSCNPVEVQTLHRLRPPPAGDQAAGFSAACFALAGRIDEERALIDGLDGNARWQAAGIVFGVAHPVADAGDDRSAGPIMELVVEYWPNHYMALYHAGMARYGLGDRDVARGYLVRFLQNYDVVDWFTENARSALSEMTP